MTDTLDNKFETVSKGSYSGHESSANYVIRDQDGWQSLWEQTNSKMYPQPVLPHIDFSREIVLGVYLGQRNSGGYDIEISNLAENESCVEVYVTEKLPRFGRNSMAFTQCYHLVKTEKTNKEIKFTKSK